MFFTWRFNIFLLKKSFFLLKIILFSYLRSYFKQCFSVLPFHGSVKRHFTSEKIYQIFQNFQDILDFFKLQYKICSPNFQIANRWSFTRIISTIQQDALYFPI